MHQYASIIPMNAGFGEIPTAILFGFYAWSLFWKGIALWRAANLKQRNWFVVLLIVNTVGILELIYLFGFAKKRFKLEELKFWE